MLVAIMTLKDTATFQVLFSYSFSILCLEHHTLEINSLTEKLNPRSAFVYFRHGLGIGLGLVSSGLGLGLVFCSWTSWS